MRKSCFSCKYASSSRPGDLTLGDFWGVEKFKIDWNDKKGTSLVMCNSIKGVGLLENISSQLRRIEEVPRDRVLEIAEKANGALIRPTKEPIMRKCFFEHLKKDNFSKALKYAETGYMDVGIVGWWIETPRSNYGSTLTDYALYVYLRSLGLSVAVISPPNFDRANAGGFNKKYGYRMTQKYTYDEMTKNNQWLIHLLLRLIHSGIMTLSLIKDIISCWILLTTARRRYRMQHLSVIQSSFFLKKRCRMQNIS